MRAPAKPAIDGPLINALARAFRWKNFLDTGRYATVSNYPGTTVEVSRATARFDRAISLLDTPGVLSLPGRSDDERATMRALLNEELRLAVQVGDAKNLRRTLTLTAMLAELGVPMVLALNMSDEAAAHGVAVTRRSARSCAFRWCPPSPPADQACSR